MDTVNRLETLCFDHILWTLENYKTEDLSLLPKKYRVEALFQLPIVDICRLEDTPFTADIAMDTIWAQLYEKYIGSIAKTKLEESWKNSLLSRFIAAIFNCGRPYGYFHKKSHPSQRFRGRMTDISTANHPVDAINYLVAMKHSNRIKKTSTLTSTVEPYDQMNFYIEMTCQQVTSVKHVGPPGKAYEENCLANQIIPPRHMTLFNTESRFLPHITVLELIRKCGFTLKSLDISLPSFAAFLLHAENERENFLEILVDCFSEVESLTFRDHHEEANFPIVPIVISRLEDIAEILIQQSMNIIAPKLKTLTLDDEHVTTHPIIHYMTHSLTTSPSCLQTLTIISEFTSCPRLQDNELQLILQHQTTLKTVSLESIQQCPDEIFEIPSGPISIWVWISAKESVPLTKLNIHSIKSDNFWSLLGTFLSLPCSQKQILSLKIHNIVTLAEGKSFLPSVATHDKKFKKKSKQKSKPASSQIDTLTRQLKKVDESTLQRKSIEFVQFVNFSPRSNPIRLGGLIATRISSARISTLLQQFIASEVRLNSVDLSSFKTTDHYKNLLKGALLKSIIFSKCENIIVSVLKQAATQNHFTFEEIVEPESQGTIHHILCHKIF